MLQAGFAKVDLTPRVGVELCGFGAFLNRHSIGVRDRLWAKALALRVGDRTAVVVSCDIIGVTRQQTRRARELVTAATGLPPAAVMIHATHTHSGPATVPNLIGWGDPDYPYLELLPGRLAQAASQAVANLQPATLAHAEVPCEGMALNREYDKDAPPLEEVLQESWRPAKPELTDTTCHVLRLDGAQGPLGWAAYFSCHPVVCCATTRYLHGDYAGVAMNLLERELPGTTGLFLQGAQGDVNSCVVHKPEPEALLALDVIASRFARAVRHGLRAAKPLPTPALAYRLVEHTFRRKALTREELQRRLAEHEAKLHAPGASDQDGATRMAMVHVLALRGLLARQAAGESLEPATDVQGFRLGEVALLATPFEMMQALKRDILAGARARVPLVMGITNDLLGYAPDRVAAARGGYAADTVPMMLGQLPFEGIHDQLVAACLELDAALAAEVAR
jgi:hypothetical protein